MEVKLSDKNLVIAIENVKMVVDVFQVEVVGILM